MTASVARCKKNKAKLDYASSKMGSVCFCGDSLWFWFLTSLCTADPKNYIEVSTDPSNILMNFEPKTGYIIKLS